MPITYYLSYRFIPFHLSPSAPSNTRHVWYTQSIPITHLLYFIPFLSIPSHQFCFYISNTRNSWCLCWNTPRDERLWGRRHIWHPCETDGAKSKPYGTPVDCRSLKAMLYVMLMARFPEFQVQVAFSRVWCTCILPDLKTKCLF